MPLPTPFPRRAARPLLASLLLAGALAACDKPRALGGTNNIVVGAPDSVWTALREEVLNALEPRTFTVRDERIFDVAQADPRAGEWGNLRLVRQVLVIGEPGDPWVAEALDEVDGPVPAPPALVQARNVWAQGQSVTVVLLPPAAQPGAARPLIHAAGTRLLSQYEQYARERMFVTGPNTALADSLRRTAGFSLVVPEVYYYGEMRPGLFVLRNDHPDPSKLIRSVEVAARPSDEVEMTPEAARAWRASVAEESTQPPQVTEAEISQSRELEVNGHPALEIQGIWSNPPGEWPAAGPYLARLVRCPDRTFLIDAWLYAPGSPKFEYMVQLNTILDSFECAG